jgi:hypothetical protein
VAGLDAAVRRCRRKRATVGALDETGQEKQGSGTAILSRFSGVLHVGDGPPSRVVDIVI